MNDRTQFLLNCRRLLAGLGAATAFSTLRRGIGDELFAQSATWPYGEKPHKPSIILFDVNETLINIESIGPLFQRIFGDKNLVREWFNYLVLYSEAITLSGIYTTFFSLGQGLLQMMGTIHGAKVVSSDVDELRSRMLSMTPHPDVPEGLKMLKEAGFRLMTLTNSPPDPKGSPLEHAGLAKYIERQFSIDSVRRFKPAPQVYHYVMEQLNLSPSAFCMVAAHVWDTIGAQSVGFSAGLVARPGNAPLPVEGLPQPQAVAPDLPGVAKQLIAYWQ